MKQSPNSSDRIFAGSRVLVLDSTVLGVTIETLLTSRGARVLCAADWSHVMEQAYQNEFACELVIVSLRESSDMNLRWLEALRRTGLSLPVLVITEKGQTQLHGTLESLQINGELSWPFDGDAFVREVARLLNKPQSNQMGAA